MARFAQLARPLAAFLLVLGIVLSPLRAVAATIPMLFAYDAAVVLAATARVETGPALRSERGGTPEYDYDAVHVGYDSTTNSQGVGGVGAVLAYGRTLDLADRREAGEAAIYAAPATTTAAEGIEAAAIQTPYAIEAQSASAAAQGALSDVQGGATIFRTGQLGTSMAGESQYWSLTSPLSPAYEAPVPQPPPPTAGDEGLWCWVHLRRHADASDHGAG
jgi:hypothetical protein